MRLTKKDEASAVSELLNTLKNFPNGIQTKDLIGSPRFHGMRTLTSRQIIRLLRRQPNVTCYEERIGYKINLWWYLENKD